jgi:hypothetical protein
MGSAAQVAARLVATEVGRKQVGLVGPSEFRTDFAKFLQSPVAAAAAAAEISTKLKSADSRGGKPTAFMHLQPHPCFLHAVANKYVFFSDLQIFITLVVVAKNFHIPTPFGQETQGIFNMQGAVVFTESGRFVVESGISAYCGGISTTGWPTGRVATLGVHTTFSPPHLRLLQRFTPLNAQRAARAVV